jgi:hypothetical protein
VVVVVERGRGRVPAGVVLMVLVMEVSGRVAAGRGVEHAVRVVDWQCFQLQDLLIFKESSQTHQTHDLDLTQKKVEG